jgi:ankyrin repeat protein
MAARRGNLAVAKALLECGADPGIGDIAGVTPLKRALNCRKPQVVALLSASSGVPRSV